MGDMSEFKGAQDGKRDVDWLDIRTHLNDAYLAYSVSVIKGRAIPDVRDGLKPVQRRLLFAMHELGLRRPGSHKKSARVVGDVLGKYHPHGDSACYEAMVRMAQDFSLRYPLIDGQGNFGTLDGDSAAAMRYTEARLADFADILLSETDKGTVDFRDNYDGSEQEPEVLPARLPMALLNTQSGIAVGLATDIPAHNLVEVGQATMALLRNPELGTADLLQYVQGPDFPGGGQVCINPQGLRALYESGRGQLPVRCRWRVEELAGKDWQIVVEELPPGISTEQVLSEIDGLSNPQPKKGSGDVNSDQKAMRQAILQQLGGIANQAGRDTGPVRMVLEPKSTKQDPEQLMAFLMAHTSLESRVKVNMTFIGIDGRPAVLSLRDVLSQWTTFRRDVVTRRSQTRLDKVDHRIHILDGRIQIQINIDEVIKIVRESDDYAAAKAGIIERFGLTDTQADDILGIPLGRLTRLDAIKLQSERDELNSEKAHLEHILADHGAMTEEIIQEMEADIAKYGDDRRSTIEDVAPVVAEASTPVIDEPITVVLSEKGWLKSRQGHNLDLSNLSFKDGDSFQHAVETRTSQSVVLFDSRGRAYTVSGQDIPGGRGYGAPLSSLVEIQNGAKIISLVAGNPEDQFLLSSANGYGFAIRFEDLLARKRAGKEVLRQLNGAKAYPPIPLFGSDAPVLVAADSGYMLLFPQDELKVMPAGKGVKLIGLKPGETMAHIQLVEGPLELPGKRGKTVVMDDETLAGYYRKRGSRGKLMPKNATGF